jgi:hypothetical protein
MVASVPSLSSRPRCFTRSDQTPAVVLGRFEAMVYVRLVRAKAKSKAPRFADEAKGLLRDGALMKYLDMPTD